MTSVNLMYKLLDGKKRNERHCTVPFFICHATSVHEGSHPPKFCLLIFNRTRVHQRTSHFQEIALRSTGHPFSFLSFSNPPFTAIHLSFFLLSSSIYLPMYISIHLSLPYYLCSLVFSMVCYKHKKIY